MRRGNQELSSEAHAAPLSLSLSQLCSGSLSGKSIRRAEVTDDSLFVTLLSVNRCDMRDPSATPHRDLTPLRSEREPMHIGDDDQKRASEQFGSSSPTRSSSTSVCEDASFLEIGKSARARPEHGRETLSRT